MSDQKQLRWESPHDIYVPHKLNNRPLDAKYVESLEDSMLTQGYLPTYPVICYRRLELPKEVFDRETDELYICAAGFHRTTAAKNIDLDRVYVEVRSGTFEDYLETLHTDNFQFDPATDTSLGQVWTKTEKRNACKQLLLLPKYFKLANIALAELWHTSESNVRRWRDEVASSIGDGSLDAPFPVSEEWQSNLKDILDSNKREMNDGSVVTIRSKSNESAREFYWELRRKVENHKDLDWDLHIEPYCKMMYEKGSSDLSLKKLSELDLLIQEHDPEFMKACRELGEKQEKLNAAQKAYSQARSGAMKTFKTYLTGQQLVDDKGYVSTTDERYKACLKSFGNAVSRRFGKNLIASHLSADKVEKYENETYQLQQLKKDIESDTDYVREFAKRMLNASLKKREKLGKSIIETHTKMLTAVAEKYPGIDMDKFCFGVDSNQFWLKTGDTPAKPIQVIDQLPDGNDKLTRMLDAYEEMLETIEKGADWIKALVPDPGEQQLKLGQQVAADAETDMWKAFEGSECSMYFGRDDLLSAAAKHIGCPKEIPDPAEMENPQVWSAHFRVIQSAITEKADWVEALLKERKAFNLALTNAKSRLSWLWDHYEGLNLDHIPREAFAIAAAKQFGWYKEGDYGSGENYLLEKDYALLKNLTTAELKKWRKRFDSLDDAIVKKVDWIKALDAKYSESSESDVISEARAQVSEIIEELDAPKVVEVSDFNYSLDTVYIGFLDKNDNLRRETLSFHTIASPQLGDRRLSELPDSLKVELLKLIESIKPSETLDNEVLCPDDEADRQDMNSELVTNAQ